MGIKRNIITAVNSLIKRYGYELLPESMLYDWQKNSSMGTEPNQPRLPSDAPEYLEMSNARLNDLRERYSHFDDRVTTPLAWTEDHISSDEMLYFRGDNAFLWQLRGRNSNVMSYALATYYIKSIDNLGLLEKLKEDDYFGNHIFNIDGRVVSRDLLDSIIEIYFLERHLNISAAKHLTILDIGAGYGRLAQRMLSAMPHITEYICTDAYPISTFISEYNLHFRNLDGKAKVVPLDEIEQALGERSVDIAVNIHSFSECQLSAIDWWLSLLNKNRVKYLMIVPNACNHGGECLLNNNNDDFGAVIEGHGYKLIVKEPKYQDPVAQEYALNPTFHYLYEYKDKLTS